MNNYERAYAIRDEIVAHRRTIHPLAEVGYEPPQTRAEVLSLPVVEPFFGSASSTALFSKYSICPFQKRIL